MVFTKKTSYVTSSRSRGGSVPFVQISDGGYDYYEPSISSSRHFHSSFTPRIHHEHIDLSSARQPDSKFYNDVNARMAALPPEPLLISPHLSTSLHASPSLALRSPSIGGPGPYIEMSRKTYTPIPSLPPVPQRRHNAFDEEVDAYLAGPPPLSRHRVTYHSRNQFPSSSSISRSFSLPPVSRGYFSYSPSSSSSFQSTGSEFSRPFSNNGWISYVDSNPTTAMTLTGSSLPSSFPFPSSSSSSSSSSFSSSFPFSSSSSAFDKQVYKPFNYNSNYTSRPFSVATPPSFKNISIELSSANQNSPSYFPSSSSSSSSYQNYSSPNSLPPKPLSGYHGDHGSRSGGRSRTRYGQGGSSALNAYAPPPSSSSSSSSYFRPRTHSVDSHEKMNYGDVKAPMSNTRKKCRDLICKTRHDPHYYD